MKRKKYSAEYRKKRKSIINKEHTFNRFGMAIFDHNIVRKPLMMQESDQWNDQMNVPVGDLSPVYIKNLKFIDRFTKFFINYLNKIGIIKIMMPTLIILPTHVLLRFLKNSHFRYLLQGTHIMTTHRLVDLIKHLNFEIILQISIFLSTKKAVKLSKVLIDRGYTIFLARLIDSMPDTVFVQKFAMLPEEISTRILPYLQRSDRYQLSRKLCLSIESLPKALVELMNKEKNALDANEALTGILVELEAKKAELEENHEKLKLLSDRIKRYIPSQLVHKLLGGQTTRNNYHRKKLTVFFSDIKDFTIITDTLEAEDLAELLNSYLNAMVEIATKHGAVIDKFIGDAIVTFFGDRDLNEQTTEKEEATKCVTMALEMKERLSDLILDWSDKGFTQKIEIRMGINTGFCTVGDFGSEFRKDYTIIGSAVNLAARLESAAPVGSLLISHATWLLVKDKFRTKKLGEIDYKGFDKPVKTYEVIGYKTEPSIFNINNNGVRIHIDKDSMKHSDRIKLKKELIRLQQFLDTKQGNDESK